MKLMSSGSLDLYRYTYLENNSNFGDPNGTMTYSYLPKVLYYLETENGDFFLIKSLGFKKKMPQYFKDRPDLVKKIQNKKLKYRNIEELVYLYNKNPVSPSAN